MLIVFPLGLFSTDSGLENACSRAVSKAGPPVATYSFVMEWRLVVSLVRLVALIFGVVFVLAGLAGFIPGITHQMDSVQGMEVADGAVLGLVPVNAVANVVHLVIGVVLIAASRTHSLALNAVRFFGFAYALLAVIGIAAPEGFGLLPLGGVELAIHILTAAVLLFVGFVNPGHEDVPARV